MRLFAQWLSSFDPAHEAPPRGLLPGTVRRSRPHIYSEAEIGSIIMAAEALPSIYGLRGLTCSTLFGLIAVTGLRISEALALDREDLDADLACCASDKENSAKSGCCRSTRASSRSRRLSCRTRSADRPSGQAAVRHGKATRLTDCAARYNFARACQQMGSGPISHTASMAGDRASTIFATASR